MTRRNVQSPHHLILWLHSGQQQSATLKLGMQQYLPGRWPVSFSVQPRTSSSCKEMALSLARLPTPLNITANPRPKGKDMAQEQTVCLAHNQAPGSIFSTRYNVVAHTSNPRKQGGQQAVQGHP